MADRKYNQKREDADAARGKGKVTRAVGTTRGPGMNSQPPSLGLGRSSISNASFEQYPDLPSTRVRGLGRGFSYEPQDFGLKNPGYNSKRAHRIADERAADARSMSRPGTRVQGGTETTSPRASAQFDASANERRNKRSYETGIAKAGLKPDLSEQGFSRNYDKQAGASESTGRGEARDAMNRYLANQTDKMRRMTGNPVTSALGPGMRSYDEAMGKAPSDMHRDGTAPAKPLARIEGMRTVNSRGESVSSAASNMDKYQKSRKGIADVDSTRRENAGMLTGALTVPMAYGLKALYDDRRQQTIDNNVNRRRDDASDMGPVKGRALERKNQFEGGRPKTMADLNQEKDVNTMKKNGTSLTKALLKDAKK
jgi:hypothetical protein